MVRHIVLFSARNEADLNRIHEALAKLRDIPHARCLEVARNARRDGLSGEIDIVVYGEFDDFRQLELYKSHPLYAKAVATVRPLRDVRIAVDYETPAP